MQRITIGRYGTIPADVARPADPALTPAQDMYDGWVEGVRDDGTSWIMFLDKGGSPECFWGDREESGAVNGEPIDLSRSGSPATSE